MSLACCFGAELTLTFEPQLRFRLEAGHEYTLYAREKLTDPWKEATTFKASTNTQDVVYSFYFPKPADQQFFWLMRDDEVPQSTIQTNTVKAAAIPPIPGGK